MSTSSNTSGRFKSGLYVGIYTIRGKNHNIEMDLNFSEGVVEGRGKDETGTFTISGEYKSVSPYNCNLVRSNEDGTTITYEGFHSSEGFGGLFGTWSGANGRGDFRISKTEPKPEELEAKRKAEQMNNKNHLLSMGFPASLVEKAITNTESLQDAVEYCTSNIDSEAGATSLNEPPEEIIKQLTDMGIQRDVAIEALITNNNDVERSINFIFGQ